MEKSKKEYNVSRYEALNQAEATLNKLRNKISNIDNEGNLDETKIENCVKFIHQLFCMLFPLLCLLARFLFYISHHVLNQQVQNP